MGAKGIRIRDKDKGRLGIPSVFTKSPETFCSVLTAGTRGLSKTAIGSRHRHSYAHHRKVGRKEKENMLEIQSPSFCPEKSTFAAGCEQRLVFLFPPPSSVGSSLHLLQVPSLSPQSRAGRRWREEEGFGKEEEKEED